MCGSDNNLLVFNGKICPTETGCKFNTDQWILLPIRLEQIDRTYFIYGGQSKITKKEVYLCYDLAVLHIDDLIKN